MSTLSNGYEQTNIYNSNASCVVEPEYIPCRYCKDRNPYCNWCNDSGGFYQPTRSQTVCLAGPKEPSRPEYNPLPRLQPLAKKTSPDIHFINKDLERTTRSRKKNQQKRRKRSFHKKVAGKPAGKNQHPTIGDQHRVLLNRVRRSLNAVNKVHSFPH